MARKKRRRQYHTGSYQYKAGRHIVQWYEAGKRRTKSFSSESEAQEHLGGLDSRATGAARPRSDKALGVLVKDWLDSRSAMASNYDDRCRWRAHWEALVGHLKPAEVTVGVLKEAIAKMRLGGLGGATIGLCLKLLSSFYGDLVEEGAAEGNPVALLSKKTRSALRSNHDPKNTPFVREQRNVGLIYFHLADRHPPTALAYAIGSMAGLRTSEVRALEWGRDVDMEARTITVRRQVARRGEGTKPTKDRDGRVVPISNYLFGIMVWNRKDSGLVIQGPDGFLSADVMREHLHEVLVKLNLEDSCACCQRPMGWYEATRHTFASHWVKNGGSLEQAKAILGHSSVALTERYYVHLTPGQFSDADRARVSMAS